MGLWNTIVKGVPKSAKFIYKHRDELKEAANVVTEAASATENIKKRRTEEKNSEIMTVITNNAKKIEELQINLEYRVSNISEELTIMKEDFNQRIQNLDNVLQQLKESQATYQKKSDFRFLLISICGSIGIVISIVLAIVL